jgi:predicted metal-dependent enzyme (double-stranded beta helix superfamily)
MLQVLLEDEQILANDDAQEHEDKYQQKLALLSSPQILHFVRLSRPGKKQQINNHKVFGYPLLINVERTKLEHHETSSYFNVRYFLFQRMRKFILPHKHYNNKIKGSKPV